MGGIAGSRYAKKKPVDVVQDAGDEVQKKKSKRKRKPKLPKNLNKEEDAERWVPLRDRSYYRGRGKWKNKRTGKFTGDQGGLDKKTEAQFDYSKKVTAPQVSSSSSGKKGGKKKGGKKR
jgi:signal recognition particle subunit SRP72